ncbi:MAG TPA: coenzyme F420-0:L-glutamate ligase [Candidatus Paceibacterota bacterium]
MKIKPIRTRIFREGENLISFILKYLPRVKEGSVIAITSKIVALAERRTVVLENTNTKRDLIIRESEIAVETRHAWLTLKDGMIMPSAGIDESNANGKLIQLPKDSFKSAAGLRRLLNKHYKTNDLAILITDSRTTMLRAGTVGVALGYAGFQGIRDYRNKRDIFGRKFIFQRANIADGLASAVVLTMGEGNEHCPLAVVTKAPVQFCKKVDKKELYIPLKDDMYGPILGKFKKS